MSLDDEVSIDNCIACTSYELDQFYAASVDLSNESIRFLHLNINGCRSNFDEFKCFLNSLSFNYTIIALTETHLNKDNDVGFELEGYKSVSNYSKHGLKLFYTKCLNVSVLDNLTFNDDYKETLFIKNKGNSFGAITFGVTYRPHCSTIEQFTASFREDILDRFGSFESVVITGDFNINLAIADSTNDIQEFINTMLEYNLFGSIDDVTRHNSLNPLNSSIIDHFWSHSQFPYSTHIIKTNISDHYIIALHTDISHAPKLVTVKFRDFSFDNKVALCNDLPYLLENLNLPMIDANESTSFFINWLNTIFNRYFPIKTKSMSSKRFKSPWLTDTLLICIKKKHKFYSMVKRGTLSKQFYNKYKNLLTLAIRKSKNSYFQNSFVNAEKNPAKMWKLLNDFMKKNKNSGPLAIKRTDDSIIEDSFEIANSLNDSFVNCSSRLRSNFPSTFISNFDDFPSIEQSIFLPPTDAPEMNTAIHSFANKNNSLDDFPFRILKLISEYLSPVLSDLFNLVLNTGVYPDCLKTTRVTPLFKAGEPSNPSNYRPISVLKTLNKIFERLLLHRLDDFISTFDIKVKTQYGFSSNLSTMDALYDLLGSIRRALQSSHHCIAVFYDFSKAFDTIDHDRLLMKLSRYGIRGTALNLIKSYLSNRFQSVIVNGIFSDPLPISHGVPQGSILGPWLFNMYVNDLAYYINSPSPIQYADNTTILAEDPCIDLLFIRLQTTLNSFQNWSLSNYLSLNCTKTKYILFSRPKLIGPHPPLIIKNDYLDSVNSIKFLGVHIDRDLNFKEHIRQVRQKLSRIVGLSYAISPSLNLVAAKSLYFALANSILLYGIVFWAPSYNNDLAPLQIAQNKIVRNLFTGKIPSNSTNQLYNKL